MAFLEHLNRLFPVEKTRVDLVLHNVSVHKGKKVRAWTEKHPRLMLHHPPGRCSWMNHVEQWFSIRACKRLVIADFVSKEDRAERLMAFVRKWNEQAHPFRWNQKSFEKILAKCKDVSNPSAPGAEVPAETCDAQSLPLAA